MTASKRRMLNQCDAFTLAYLECALWASTDETTESGGYPLDDNYTIQDLTVASLRSMIRDCKDFQDSSREDLSGLDRAACGHDFWLSRNGHGAGFWDRGLGELGDRLHKATKPYGSCDLMVWKGKIHAS